MTRESFNPSPEPRRRPPAALGAWLILLVAVVHPASGTALVLCPSRLVLDAPCPGCGLTRSLSCAVRGQIEASVAQHPFGLPILALAIAAAVLPLVPAQARADAAQRLGLGRRARVVAAAAAVAVFLAFGLLRVAV